MNSNVHSPVDMFGAVMFPHLPKAIAACLFSVCITICQVAICLVLIMTAVPAFATMHQVRELETRRFVDPISRKTAFALARASAWLKALAKAKTSLPVRRKLAWADSGGQRLALVAQVYIATAMQLTGSGWQENPYAISGKIKGNAQPDLVGVNLTLIPVADAATAMDLALRNPELLTMRLALVNETIRLVNIMESHWNEKTQLPEHTAREAGKRQPSDTASSSARASDKTGEQLIDSGKATGTPANQARHQLRNGQVWQIADWEKAATRLEALWRVQSILDLTPDGWFTAPAALPILENAARACPEMPVILLLLAEAQLQRDLPERSVDTCTRVLGLAPAISRARYIRALAHWRLDQPALAETDLDAAISVGHGPNPQGDELARRLRARGALRQMRRNIEGMCADFLAACSLGDCDGYASARKMGQCLQ